MTPEAQRIAIAEACGWQCVHPEVHAVSEGTYDYSPRGMPPHHNLRRVVPDYLNDLNAMHEAEKVVLNDDEKHHHFSWMLVQVLEKFRVWRPEEYKHLKVWEMSLYDVSDCLHATAAQRAEAFLRTIGKWQD